MFLNFRYPLVLFLASLVFMMGGLAFKILHWAGSNFIIGSMLMVQAFSIIWLLVIIVKSPKS